MVEDGSKGWLKGGGGVGVEMEVGMEWNGILYIFFSALIVHILLSATQIRSYSRSTVASCFRKSETISGH